MSDERINIKKDSIQTFNMKKQDRLLIDGPCEIEITEISISGSLDYQIKTILSTPYGTKTIKLGPGTKTPGSQLNDKEKNPTRRLNS